MLNKKAPPEGEAGGRGGIRTHGTSLYKAFLMPYHRPLGHSSTGAGSGTRTHNIQLGKLTLYQLSYARMEPLIRFERMTIGLQNRSSTPELKRQW